MWVPCYLDHVIDASNQCVNDVVLGQCLVRKFSEEEEAMFLFHTYICSYSVHVFITI